MSGATKPGPSEDYKALLAGEIGADEYVRRVKRDVDERLGLSTVRVPPLPAFLRVFARWRR